MRRLRLRDPEIVDPPHDYERTDCAALVAEAASRGLALEPSVARAAYAEWSEQMSCAGWLTMGDARFALESLIRHKYLVIDSHPEPQGSES